MKRFLLWIISVALGVVVLLAAVMGVSYAFTTEGGCPDGAAQFGGQALEANGSCWQVPLLGGQLDKVFASPATLTVQKLGVLYTAHPELSLPEWTGYTALTIQNAAGDVLFAGSAGEYQNFLFPANGEYKAELTAWRVPKGGVITQCEGGSTGQLRKNLDGNQMTGWCVIDGQPYAFGTNGEPKQGWDHSHEKSYYFINGVSQSGTFGEGALSSNLNGSGSVQPVGDQAPEDDLAKDAEGEPPEEELLEAQPTQTETTEAGQTAPAAQQPTQSPEGSAAEQETTSKAPTAPETPAQEQQEEGTENT